MKTTTLALVLAAAAAVASIHGAAYADVKVYPLDCLTMVNPLDGHSVAGLGKDGGEDWKKGGAVWDGQVVRLGAARGERLSFQLVLTRSPKDTVTGVAIELDLPQARDVRTWRSWCIWNTPEIAVPLKGAKYAFDLPSTVPMERVRFDTNTYLAWSAGVDFTVPRDAKAGTVKGHVTVSAKEGLETVKLPVELTVYPFEIPRRPKLLVEMNSYGDWHKFLGRKVEPYLAIHRLMRDHRCTFVEVPYGQGGYISSPYLSPSYKNRKMGGKPTVDWETFDKAVGGLFDGSAFADGQPVSHFILPICYGVPVNFKWHRESPDEYKRMSVEIRKRWIEHIAEKGWKDTVFQEFHNENPSAGAKCPWHLDEPRSAKDMEGHKLYLDIFHDAAKDLPKGVQFRYRIDISDWRRLGPSFREAAPRIQDWIVSRDRKYLNDASAPMFRKYADAHGGMLLEYGEINGFMARGKPVNWSRLDRYSRDCWTYKLDGYEQWMIDMWKCKDVQEPYAPLFYSNAAGARDLIWPGNHLGIDGPLPSLRLKAIRESLNLFDYAYMAVAKDPKARGAVGKLLAEMDTGTSAAHYAVKAKLAAMLSR